MRSCSRSKCSGPWKLCAPERFSSGISFLRRAFIGGIGCAIVGQSHCTVETRRGEGHDFLGHRERGVLGVRKWSGNCMGSYMFGYED